MGDRPIRRSSDRSLGGWWPRVLASLSGRGSPAENEPSRRGHSPIDGRGASGDARPGTAGPDDSGTTRSGAVTYDISSNYGCAPSAAGDDAARNGGGPDDHGRGPAATANIAARSNVVADTTTPLDGRAKGRASGNAACPSRSRAVGSTEPGRTNSPERSDGSSNQPPPGSGGTSSRIASHNASGSRYVGGRPPTDPDGAGSARV